MAQARKYTKSIDIWKTTTVPDGHGGSTISTAFEFSMWANVVTKRSFRTNEQGQQDNFIQTTFTVRNRVNLDISIKDSFIVYNSLTYNIDDLLNVDLDNIDIKIQATQRE